MHLRTLCLTLLATVVVAGGKSTPSPDPGRAGPAPLSVGAGSGPATPQADRAYENRLLQREDFANDKVDAGHIGAGHEVTALYEITPAGSGGDRLPPLRYRQLESTARADALAGEVAHLRLRYKQHDSEPSKLIETPVLASSLQARPSQSLRFATAAAYADLLRGGSNIGDWSWNDVLAVAREARGEDTFGLRGEFVGLVEQGRQLVETRGAEPAVASD